MRRPDRGSLSPVRRLLLALVVLSALTAPAAALPPETSGTTDPVGTWPLRPDPAVVRGFDPPLDPWGAGHRGVDLLGRPGQGVLAVLPGTVTYAGVLAGRGVVVVSHGATRTTYEPVEASVEVGTVVGPGQRLGALQAGPSHCAPRTCLHWGWIEGTAYLDPLRLVGAGPVRLLPFLSGSGPGLGPGAGPAATSSSLGRPSGPTPLQGPVPAPTLRPPVPSWW